MDDDASYLSQLGNETEFVVPRSQFRSIFRLAFYFWSINSCIPVTEQQQHQSNSVSHERTNRQQHGDLHASFQSHQLLCVIQLSVRWFCKITENRSVARISVHHNKATQYIADVTVTSTHNSQCLGDPMLIRCSLSILGFARVGTYLKRFEKPKNTLQLRCNTEYLLCE